MVIIFLKLNDKKHDLLQWLKHWCISSNDIALIIYSKLIVVVQCFKIIVVNGFTSILIQGIGQSSWIRALIDIKPSIWTQDLTWSFLKWSIVIWIRICRQISSHDISVDKLFIYLWIFHVYGFNLDCKILIINCLNLFEPVCRW